jgi:NAD(P)-dependent dehydrogenase (short-subunit alcohol dehydrogenase family)
MKLRDKVAVIYGAGGAVGSAVARAFAREGAKLYLTGRQLAKVDGVAKDLSDEKTLVHTGEVDALDETSVERHIDTVLSKEGRIDISFNAVGIPNTHLQGVPYVELDIARFLEPIITYARSYFITARVAGRKMVPQKSGVILTVTSTPSRSGIALMGGVAPAMSAVESITRGLSSEFAPHGVRVVGIRPLGMPDSGTIQEVYGLHAKGRGMSWQQFHDAIAGRTHARRVSTLSEMANVAAFAASDEASGMTGTTINLGLGSLDD